MYLAIIYWLKAEDYFVNCETVRWKVLVSQQDWYVLVKYVEVKQVGWKI